MDTDGTTTTQLTDEEKRGRRRLLAQQAVALAMQGRWDDAADTNREILEYAPDDVEAANRLGKALTELGRIGEAREAYQNAIRHDPANIIALRNLERLDLISETEAAELATRARGNLDPRFFTEETGKTAILQLQSPAAVAVLATMSAGTQVDLEVQGNTMVVTTLDGTYLGRVDERLAARLVRLMDGGNQYQAGVVGVDNNVIRVIIRETFQAPQNVGRISFPPQAEALPRPYVREGLLRRGPLVVDEEDEELSVDTADFESDDEEEDEEGSAFGFREDNPDDE